MHDQVSKLREAALGAEHVGEGGIPDVGLQLEGGHLADGILIAAQTIDQLGHVDVVHDGHGGVCCVWRHWSMMPTSQGPAHVEASTDSDRTITMMSAETSIRCSVGGMMEVVVVSAKVSS